MECKRAAKRRSSSDSNVEKQNTFESVSQNSSLSQTSRNIRTLSISSDDSDGCKSFAINSSNECSSDEETQNLNDYRKCMKILRNRRDSIETNNDSINRSRKRLAENNLRLNSSAKKFFK